MQKLRKSFTVRTDKPVSLIEIIRRPQRSLSISGRSVRNTVIRVCWLVYLHERTPYWKLSAAVYRLQLSITWYRFFASREGSR